MNKKFKKICGIACCATLAAGVLAMSACGGSGSSLYDGFGSEYLVTHEDGKEVTYTFEAEYLNFSNKAGPAFSGDYTEEEMIRVADSSSGNGYAVSGMCQYGNSLNFIIVSDRDVEDATLILRLGSEQTTDYSFTFTAETFLVRVDPVSEADLLPYNADPSGAWGNWDDDFLAVYDDENGWLPFAGYYLTEWDCGSITVTATEQDPSGFEDFTVTTKLKLQAGINCISLITNNNDRPNAGQAGSTLEATAPVVDSIKIKTSANLGMYSPQKNADYFDVADACTFR